MKTIQKRIFKYVLLLVITCISFHVEAGSILSSNHTAQVCEDASCAVSATSPVNFGVFTGTPASNVVVSNTELSGYIWGASFGWAVLNCSNTTSGCSGTNGNFKVANDGQGHLSGYAWGQDSGWINFGPFPTSGTSPITINSSGQFNGYAWAQNHGWIKFDCSNPSYCVQTDWRPTTSGGGGGGGGGPTICNDPNATNIGGPAPCTYPTFCTLHPTDPSCNPTPSFCTLHPNDPSCVVQPFCTVHPTDPTCNTTPIFCTLHPTDPSCNPTPSFCTLHPNDPSCVVPPPICTGPNCNTPPPTCSGPNCVNPPPVKKTIDSASRLFEKPKVVLVTRTITTAGALSGIILSFSTALFANPLTFSELFLIPIRLWSLFLSALGIKKRNRPWGIVYDSVTKQPLDPAYVILQDLSGNEVTTSITDLDGRYGFLVPAGSYRMIAHKTNYEFPSRKLSGTTNDELYADLYFNEIITVAEGGVITKNIPMDPLNFDWNEFAKKDQGLMKFYSKRDVLVTRISNILFYFGFIVTTLAILVTPEIYNMVTFAVYVILFILKHTVLKPRPYGRLTYKGSGVPLSFAIIRVFASSIDREIIKKVSDQTGKYYCLVPNGTYYIKIEVKNPDASYSPIYTSSPIEVKNGYINKKFEV